MNKFEKNYEVLDEGLKELLLAGALGASALGNADAGVPKDKPAVVKEFNNYTDAKNLIKKHEGFRNVVYRDTKKIPTIGVGFNLLRKDARGKLKSLGVDINAVLKGKALTNSQVESLFAADFKMALEDAKKFVPNFDSLPVNVQSVLINMSFNLGFDRLSKFKQFKAALVSKNFRKAAAEMVDSKWYGEVGNRSKELVNMMKT